MRKCPLIIEKGNVLYIGRMLKLNWYLNEQRKEPEIDMKKILSLFIACSILTSVISFVPVFGTEDKEVYFSMDDIATDMQLLPKGGEIDQYSDDGNAVLRMKSPATADPPIARFMITRTLVLTSTSKRWQHPGKDISISARKIAAIIIKECFR